MSEEEVVKEDDTVTHYIFVKNEYKLFAPQYVVAKGMTIDWIFPVPRPNVIGTLDDQNNGITHIKFGNYGTEPECTVIAKNYGEKIYDVAYYRFSPNFVDDTIVYSQTNLAVVANVKTGETFYADSGVTRVNGYLLGIRFLDPQNKLFVVVKSIFSNSSGDRELENYLHITKLEGHEFVDIGWVMKIGKVDYRLMKFPLYNTWCVHDRKLFVYDQKWHKITCTNGKQSVLHKFSEVFNANADSIGNVRDIAIHPQLPFAAIIEEYAPDTLNLVTLRWDITDPKKTGRQVVSFNQVLEPLKSLFDLDSLTLAYPSFSPDGSWYVVGLIGRDEWDMHETSHFVAIPVVSVDKKHPYFLDIDNLVILGQVTGLTSIAWTTEPTSYVVSNGELLQKWDLDELPNARVFEMPEDGAGERKPSILGRIARVFGSGGE